VSTYQKLDSEELFWDDTVEKWLPEFRGNPQGNIKLRQLLSHTSGVRDYLPNPEIDTFAVLKKR
jgi:CubicO group peptidase (beta-lactamase class C family)